MRDREPTVRSRELGEGLRRAMEGARLNGRQAAHQLGWSPSWVSRLLSGKRSGVIDFAAHPTTDEVLAIMESVRATSDSPGATRESILADLATDRR